MNRQRLTLFIDHSGDTLDTTSSCKTSDGGLGNTLDVVSENLPVSLGTTLAEALATFAASSHVDGCLLRGEDVKKRCGN